MPVPVQPQREPNDPSSTPPWKIPSLAPPVLSPSANMHPSLPPERSGARLKRRIAIGAGGAAAASLLVVIAVAALRSHRLFVGKANATGASPSAQLASVDAPSLPASAAGGSAETQPPATTGPVGAPGAAASHDTQAPFAPAAARHELDSKKRDLAKCSRGKAWGYGLATVTFANDGSVDKVALGPSFAGTPTGECASATLATTRIAPFAGAPRPLVYKFYVAPK